MYILRNLYTCKLKECRSIVYVLHHACNVASDLRTRQTSEQRCSERLFIHPTFVEPSMLAHVEALIRCVDNECIVHEPVLFKIVEYAAHIAVNRCDYTQIVAHILLIFPGIKFLTLKTRFLEFLDYHIVVCIPCQFLLGIHIVVYTTARSLKVGTAVDGTILIGKFQVVYKIHILGD